MNNGQQPHDSVRRLPECLKRWTRIHLVGTQSRDLFYPVCAFSTWPAHGVRLGLVGGRPREGTAHVNRIPVKLAGASHEGEIVWFEFAPAEAVVPGENIVSLPVSWHANAVLVSANSSGSGLRLGWGSHPAGVVSSGHPGIDGAARFLINSLTAVPGSDIIVSLTAFDVEANSARLWSWYWTTAITYEALARLSLRGVLNLELGRLERGLRSRQRQTGAQAGSYMVRWDPDRRLDAGVVPWHAPNDCAFIGLHGLLTAAEMTGDAGYLDQAEHVARWIVNEGISEGRLRVGWDDQRQRWDDSWLYLDAAWTPAFLVEMYRRRGDRGWLEAADRLARDIVERFGTRGPYYRKIWRANGRHTRTIFARGMAWVLEGWLPLLTEGSDWLLPRVRALVEAILRDQRPDGSWNYLIDRPASGACNKGTPALALHLNRARRLLPDLDSDIRSSVDAALRWCEARQIMVTGSSASGGIVSQNQEGAIATVRNIATAFNYGAAYYLLAREEFDA